MYLVATGTLTNAVQFWLVVVFCVAVFVTLGGIYLSRWTIAMIAFTVVLVCAIVLVSGSL